MNHPGKMSFTHSTDRIIARKENARRSLTAHFAQSANARTAAAAQAPGGS